MPNFKNYCTKIELKEQTYLYQITKSHISTEILYKNETQKAKKDLMSPNLIKNHLSFSRIYILTTLEQSTVTFLIYAKTGAYNSLAKNPFT